METTYKMEVIRKPKPDPRLMTQTELFAYVHELETENARLEELYQKSVGVIAATDCAKCKNKEYFNDVNYAISCIRDFCRSNNDDCETCAASKKDGCMFVDFPDGWENFTVLIDDGGVDNA